METINKNVMERHLAKHGKETLFGVVLVIIGLAITVVFLENLWFLGFAVMLAGGLIIADGTNIKKEHHHVHH